MERFLLASVLSCLSLPFPGLPPDARDPSVVFLCPRVLQADRDTDPVKLPGEAEKFYRLAQFDEAEKDLRAQFTTAPSDKIRTGLLQVLVRARKVDAAFKEASDAILGAKDEGTKAFAIAVQAHCRWKQGDAEGARRYAAEAVKLADTKGSNAYPHVRRSIATTLGFLAWTRSDGKRVAVWRPAGSTDGAAVAGKLEASAEAISKDFGSAPGLIDVFIFTDQRQADAILGVPLSFAAPRDRTVYALESSTVGHELVRVVGFFAASQKGKERPKCELLLEGAAVAFAREETWTARMAAVPARLAREGQLKGAAELAKATGGDAEFVACAGSFVRMLFDRYGREKWLKLWVGFNDAADPWSDVYGKTLEALDAEWKTHVSR